MKIVVIGGSGLIGTRVVKKVADLGHQPLAASPSTGVDATTGRGLTEALSGAAAVVDVSNSASFDDAAVLAFFESSGRNLMPAEAQAGVRHHIALSVVGTDRLQTSGYFRAKLVQERLIRASGIPYTIVRSTQFFEFLGAVAAAGTDGQVVRLPDASIQPIAAEDVATALAEIALAAPVNGTIEIAGPERLSFRDAVRPLLAARGDTRHIVVDQAATYFGARLDDDPLVPADPRRLGTTRYEAWLRR